ncbi:hypothetical protein [Algoriphagus aquimarinus]|uniref:Uncharacterized protein n=1 Tax=Algoriphagus aquimarinus TaxID=237018 RepID=A0A1I1BS21_9BACT|nr:hypothetical protein [Algoriphagus aquimarinus]SFB51488.1 hypothetical protein SAMN04489723_11567 [Algoriphagus aquimarinus]|tara:strand:- start:69530 stop:70363 length:834 start_codon:yes stop_codon:yes gene_type:complete
MKNTLNTSLLVLLLISAMILTSCDNLNDTPNVQPDLSVVNDQAIVNRVFEDLDNITLNVLGSSGLGARTNVNIPATSLCDGATVTLDEAKKTIKIDFGTSCTGTYGTVRKGIVLLTYTGKIGFPGAKVTTTFEGYEVDGLKVEGTRTLLNKGVDLETNTINLEVTIQNGKVTWPDNTFMTIVSKQERAIKLSSQGYEASIKGTVSGMSREIMAYSGATTDPLVYTETCIKTGVTTPNSGILVINYNGIDLSINYGSGSCDKKATITYPGGSKEVTLD